MWAIPERSRPLFFIYDFSTQLLRPYHRFFNPRLPHPISLPAAHPTSLPLPPPFYPHLPLPILCLCPLVIRAYLHPFSLPLFLPLICPYLHHFSCPCHRFLSASLCFCCAGPFARCLPPPTFCHCRPCYIRTCPTQFLCLRLTHTFAPAPLFIRVALLLLCRPICQQFAPP